MQVRSKREQMLIVICVLVLVAALASVLMPAGKTAAQHAMLPTDSALAEWRNKAVTYQKLGKDQDAMEPRIKKMTYTEPPDTVAALVTQQLQDIADRSGIHLREIKPLRLAKMPSGLVVRVPLEVRFRAAFQPDVMRFLYYLEDPGGKMVVDRVDITSADSRLKTVEISARVSVFTQSVTGVNGTGEGDTSNGTESNGQG
jgi:hypothetical protein